MAKNPLHEEAQATLKRLETIDPGLKELLDEAYGYAVFPAVGKAALVVGGAYGQGEVYEKGKVAGYATLAQLTIGVQLGGETFSEVIAFESRESFDRFKRGKVAFAANAAAVLVKAGAATSENYESGVSVYVHAEGGLLLELAIGGQKFTFKPASKMDGEQNGKDGRSEQKRRSSKQRGAKATQSKSSRGSKNTQRSRKEAHPGQHAAGRGSKSRHSVSRSASAKAKSSRNASMRTAAKRKGTTAKAGR